MKKLSIDDHILEVFYKLLQNNKRVSLSHLRKELEATINHKLTNNQILILNSRIKFSNIVTQSYTSSGETLYMYTYPFPIEKDVYNMQRDNYLIKS